MTIEVAGLLVVIALQLINFLIKSSGTDAAQGQQLMAIASKLGEYTDRMKDLESWRSEITKEVAQLSTIHKTLDEIKADIRTLRGRRGTDE